MICQRFFIERSTNIEVSPILRDTMPVHRTLQGNRQVPWASPSRNGDSPTRNGGICRKSPEERMPVERKGTAEHGKAEQTELIREGSRYTTWDCSKSCSQMCFGFFKIRY